MASSNRKTPAKKPAAKSAAARKPANRRTTADAGPPSLSLAHVQGFGVGAAVGVILGAAGVTWLAQEGMPKADSSAEPARLEQDSEPEPRFDFYTVLPSQNLDLTSDITPPDPTEPGTGDLYVLQAGSFRSSEDADRRRGELALLGLEATIDRTESDNGAWYRVYLGPFESRSKMAQARSITAQQSIDTLLLRRPRSP